MSGNINFYAIDHKDGLAYVHGGYYPIRREGHNPSLPVSGDGSMDWSGLRDFADNPKTLKREAGYLMNWNNRPERDWISSDLWHYTWARADRSQLIINRLQDLPISMQRFKSLNKEITTRDVNSLFLLPYLQQAQQRGLLDRSLASYIDELERWDKSWISAKGQDNNSYFPYQPTIMSQWLQTMLTDLFQDDVAQPFLSLYTSTGYPNRALGASLNVSAGTKILVKALDTAMGKDELAYDFFNGVNAIEFVAQSFRKTIEDLIATQGVDYKQWQLKSVAMQWKPFNFRGVRQSLAQQTYKSPHYLNRGAENNIFISDGKQFTTFDINPPGQSGFIDSDNKKSTHFDDQWSRFLQFDYVEWPQFQSKKIPTMKTTVLHYER